jgi:hypothetical protein
LPTQIGPLDYVQIILIHDNNLTGRTPSEWGLLLTLTDFHAAKSRLTGEIGPHVGLLANFKLTIFNVSNNSLSGTLPWDLCQLEEDEEAISSSSVFALNFGCSDVLCGCSCTCFRDYNKSLKSK